MPFNCADPSLSSAQADAHNPPGEVDLEEIYYYRINRPEGYADPEGVHADRRLDEQSLCAMAKWCWFRKAIIQSLPPMGITFIS